MGRRSSRPSGGRRAASPRPPARRASTSTRPAKKPAPPPQKATPAAPPAPAQAAAPSPGGSFMSNVASTGLGVMAGRAMDRALFGGGAASSQPAAEEPDVQSYDAQEYSAAPEEIPDSVCQREVMEFAKCMQANGSKVEACQWNIDILAACQRQQEAVGFAELPRM